jgi:hypothetical protein
MKTPLGCLMRQAFISTMSHACYNQAEILAAIRAMGGVIRHEGDDSILVADGEEVYLCGDNLSQYDSVWDGKWADNVSVIKGCAP